MWFKFIVGRETNGTSLPSRKQWEGLLETLYNDDNSTNMAAGFILLRRPVVINCCFSSFSANLSRQFRVHKIVLDFMISASVAHSFESQPLYLSN